jgi:DNA-cytosine methyltransferase
MNVLSLFDGISCGKVALIKNGIKIKHYYTSEIDNHAMEISQKNFPENMQLGNVKNIDSEKLSSLKNIDLIFAGFPCQDISYAGKRLGLKGERSGLFWEFHRILKTIQKRNPNVLFLVENVGGITTHDMELISDALNVSSIYLDAGYFSPQRRKRHYWTNLPLDAQLPKRANTSVLGDILENNVSIIDYELPEKWLSVYERLNEGENWRQLSLDHPERIQIENTRAKHTNPGGQSGFWKIYSKQEKSPTLLAQGLKQKMTRFVIKDWEYKIRYPTPLEFERLQGLPEGYTEGVKNYARYKMIGNGWNVNTIQWLTKNI